MKPCKTPKANQKGPTGRLILLSIMLVLCSSFCQMVALQAKATCSLFCKFCNQNEQILGKNCEIIRNNPTFSAQYSTIFAQYTTEYDNFVQPLPTPTSSISQALNYCSIEPYSNSFHSSILASAQLSPSEQRYAKAKENCFLFLSEQISTSRVLFTIPEGYFVKILEEQNPSAIKVQYLDRVGYCLPETIKRVSITPTKAYLEPFEIQTRSNSGTQLRESPTTSSNAIALIPPNSKITYIASTIGSKPVDGLSSEWYFVQYFPESEPTTYHEGYVYCERISSIVSPPENTEDDPIVPLPLLSENQNTTSEEFSSSPAFLKGILIAVLCLPILLFAIYICAKIISKKRSFDSI